MAEQQMQATVTGISVKPTKEGGRVARATFEFAPLEGQVELLADLLGQLAYLTIEPAQVGFTLAAPAEDGEEG